MKRFSDIGFLDQAAPQLCADVTVHQRQYSSFGDDHDVLRGWKPGFVQPEKLTQKALDPVPLYGVSRLLAYRHPEPSDARWVQAGDDREVNGITPYPLLINPQIVLAFPDAFIPAKGLGFHVVPPLSRGLTDLPLARPRDYTASLFLPFARRRLRTSLPPRVDIRTRKPWVRFRLVLLNTVNVFFIVLIPGLN
jgi:hypothetical protein